jgi:hypothetical protein
MKHLLVWLAFVYSSSLATYAQPLVVFQKDPKENTLSKRKMGLKDASGKVVVKPVYHTVYDYSQYGFFLAAQENTGYFLDARTGKKLDVPAHMDVYRFPNRFINNRMPVKRVINGEFLWGFINPELKEVIPAQFPIVSEFNPGVQVTSVYGKNEKKWGMIDTSGNLLIPCEYDNLYVSGNQNDSTSPDFNAVYVKKNNETYYVNFNGEKDYNATANQLFNNVKYEDALYLYFNLPEQELTPASLQNIGIAYYRGYFVEKNPIEAMVWFEKAAAKNMKYSISMLAHIYMEGWHGIPVQTKKGIQLLERNVQLYPHHNHVHSQLGKLYLFGRDDLPKNPAKAFGYFMIRAKEKNVEAMRYIAYMYQNGIGTERNEALANQWLREAKSIVANKPGTPWDAMPGIDFETTMDLKNGQVVLYNGKKGVVINNSSLGVLLHDNRIIPPNAAPADYTILNEKKEDYLVTCPLCQGKGVHHEKIKSGSVSFTDHTLYSGSTITGDYIKSTTKTYNTYVSREVRCGLCSGTGKSYRK